MDAVQLLIDQHRKIEQRLDDALASIDTQPEQRRTRLADIGDHLGLHLTSEEEVFYPAVKHPSTEDILRESLEEHLSLKRLLADLLALPPQDATFEAKLKVLDEQTRHHHGEEEENLFPRVRQFLPSAALQALARRIEEAQSRLEQGEPREVVAEQTDKAAPL